MAGVKYVTCSSAAFVCLFGYIDAYMAVNIKRFAPVRCVSLSTANFYAGTTSSTGKGNYGLNLAKFETKTGELFQRFSQSEMLTG